MIYDIYIDMDGVLADFDQYVTQANGGVHPTKEGKSVWKFMVRGSFLHFRMMEDAQNLWDYVLPYAPTIMTATGHSLKHAGIEKTYWAWNNLSHKKVITCRDGADKAGLIHPDLMHKSILVDDRLKAIDPWIDAGGIGILHTSAKDSIEALKQLLEK